MLEISKKGKNLSSYSYLKYYISCIMVTCCVQNEVLSFILQSKITLPHYLMCKSPFKLHGKHAIQCHSASISSKCLQIIYVST